MIILSVWFLVVLSLKKVTGSSQWVDPHSMKLDKKYPLPSLEKPLENTVTFGNCEKTTCNSDAYYRRIIRLLLSNAHLGEDPELGYFAGDLNMRFNLKDRDFLRKFASDEKASPNDFEEAQTILETAFQKTVIEKVEDFTLSIQDRLYLIFFNTLSAVLLAAVLMLFICYTLLKGNFTWWSIIKYFALLMYVFDFAITYLHLFENEEIENMVSLKMHGTVPPECNPQNMQWLDYLKFLYNIKFSETNCQKYYQTNHRTLVYAVTPLKVLSHQFGIFIIGPLTHLGTGLGQFSSAMFGSMPFGLNFILFPIMLFTVCIVICILMIFATNTFVKMRIFPFITFELGGDQGRRQPQIGAVNPGDNFNRVEDVPRNRLRVVSNNKKKNNKAKKEICNKSSSSSAGSTPVKDVNSEKVKLAFEQSKKDLMANEPADKCDSSTKSA